MEKFRFSEESKKCMEAMAVPFAVYQFIDKRIVTLILSDGFCKLFGYDDKRAAYNDMDHDMYKHTHADDVMRISDAAIKFATNKSNYDVIYRSRSANSGGYRIIHAIGQHVYTANGDRIAYVWYTDEGEYIEGESTKETNLNLSLQKSLHEESILKASYYDYLTGLPSMSYFFELANAGKGAIIKAGGHPVMLFFDLSGMKFYNSKYGFSEGDKLIRSLSKMLSSYFGSECCSRFGSDHFSVYTEETGLEPTLHGIFSDWHAINPEYPRIRVGIFKSDIEDVDAGTACDRAKIACDRIRNTTVSAFNYFSEELLEDIRNHQYIIENIDKAIRNKWIQVYYQPIVRAVNGRVCDEEALARWIDPEKGFLSPSDFIPTLEASGLIYKLDLYVVEQVLEKIKLQRENGLFTVSQSINLSRADFDACNIVDEICRRVDEAGIGRNMINIEITESIIGSDFEFIKRQIEKFQSLGFSVWMDDFGSGYSSLDVLQNVKFQLIKFDMSFMKQFDQGNNGKIILTELMKMATALGVDTVCEGVETEEQVKFLREIGCSKLQGYYYAKPIPFDAILERYKKGIQIGFEDPKESGYYETIGKLNLHDLIMMAGDNERGFYNYFDALPMAIVELKDGNLRLVRSNHSYRKFISTRYGVNLSKNDTLYNDLIVREQNSTFVNIIKECCDTGSHSFFDETLKDGSTVHSFAKKLSENPKTGAVAVAFAILSIMDSGQGTTYANIARALAADYTNLFYVDLLTDDFIEYRSESGADDLAMEREGNDFFEASRRDAHYYLHEDDLDAFLAVFTKENLIKSLNDHGTFTTTYRQMINGRFVYVSMKAMHMSGGKRYMIIGVNNVDSQMKRDKHR